ncbi:MAG: precorrin-3B synthase [Acetobacter sp.]
MQEEADRNRIKVDACRAMDHFDKSACRGLTPTQVSPTHHVWHGGRRVVLATLLGGMALFRYGSWAWRCSPCRLCVSVTHGGREPAPRQRALVAGQTGEAGMYGGFAQPEVKGWCPGLFAPMEAADGWLVRVRPQLGRLEAAQAFLLADVAQKQGNGRISLTNRASLQLRGFGANAARRFPDIAVAAGLGLPDAGMERRQAMLVSPLAGDDPTCAPDTVACAESLRNALLGAKALSALPGKFGFAVDGGGLYACGLLQADITLRAAGGGLWSVVCGGACSAPIPYPAAVRLAVDMAHAFVSTHQSTRPQRDAALGARLFQLVGHTGYVPQPQTSLEQGAGGLVGALGHGLFALSVPMGCMTATMLHNCAHVAATQGDGILRLTPWHTLVLGGMVQPPKIAGMVADPTSALLRIWACSGAGACAQAEGKTEELARHLAPLLPVGASLHVSGCRKGCAHPSAANFTLVAGEQGYGLVRNGTATGCVEGLFATEQAVYKAFESFKHEGAVDAGL